VRSVGSVAGRGGVARLGRVLGVLAAGAVLTVGLGACAKSVTGSAVAGAAITTAPPTSAPDDGGDSGSTPPSAGSPSSGDSSASQQAQQTCSQLPKDAVTSAFGVPDVSVTADSGSTLDGGVLQIKCVISSSNGFRANVVVQVYPSSTLSTAQQYETIMKQKYPPVQTLTGVDGADVAGLFKQTVDGAPVDEAFAAKKDAESDTVDVVLAGVADAPGITAKLTQFIGALANS
jgi:hypothetical protein